MGHKSFISSAAALALAGSVCATTYAVNNPNDAFDGECVTDISLRDALSCAAASGDTITIPLSGKIDVTGGLISINKNVTIAGPLSHDLNITSSTSSEIIEINASNVVFSDLTFSGMTAMSGNAVISVVSGGGLQLNECNMTKNSDQYAMLIDNSGTLTIVGGEVSENYDIGGISNSGTLTLNGVLIKNNAPSMYTGTTSSIRNSPVGNVTIIDSIVTGNSSPYDGGVMENNGTLHIENTRFEGNIANGSGGVIKQLDGTLTIANSMFKRNSASYSYGSGNGGAIAQTSGVTLISQSDFIENNTTANGGGAIYISGGSVSIADSNLSGNTTPYLSNGGAIYNDGGELNISTSSFSDQSIFAYGAAIANRGSLTITKSYFINNTSIGGDGGGYGGAIYNEIGTMQISETEFDKNNAYSKGGAIAVVGGSVTIDRSWLHDNNATYFMGTGGAISIEEGPNAATRVEINATTISGNIAGVGGGISASYGYGGSTVSLDLRNTTVSGNTADTGGGLYLYSTNVEANISHSTIAKNNASYGGAFYSYDASVNIKSTIVSDSNTTSDCYAPGAPVTSWGYNLVENNTSCAGFGNTGDFNADPQLLSLADNGGPTLTHALNVTSPVRGAGSSTDINGNTVLTDQRGFTRPPSLPAIGAYEPIPADINLSTGLINFGTLYVGDTSAEHNVTITSLGDDALTINTPSIQSGTTDFTLANYCLGVTLQRGDSCNVGITFTPSQSSLPYLDYLNINTSLGISAQVELQGAGTDVPVPYIGVSPVSLDFGDVNVSETKNLDITVSNSGSANLAITAVSLLNSVSQFALDYAGCSAEIVPSGSCTIGVAFTPTATGSVSDAVVITSNAGNTLDPVSLAGNGVSVSDENGTVVTGPTVSGTITLPSTITHDVTVLIFIDIDGKDRIEKAYTLISGTPVSFSLEIPDGTETFRVGYYIRDDVTGMVQKGFFTGSGTTAYVDEAAVYSTSVIPADIALDVLSGKLISGTVLLPQPAADYTELDITATVDILGLSALFRHQLTSNIELVPGQQSAEYNLTVPSSDTSSKYYVAYDFFESTDYVREGYYGTSGTTPYFSEAAAVDVGTGNRTNIDLNVTDGVTISGTASIVSPPAVKSELLVRAIREDGYEAFGVIGLDADTSSVNYAFDVPATSTAKSYRLGYYLLENAPAMSDRIIGYWNSAGTVTNLDKAEAFPVTATAVSGKNLTVSDTSAQTMGVKAGWNLLSLPSKAEFTYFDMLLHFGFDQNGVVNMAKYNPAGWSYYMVKGLNETVNRFNRLRSGEGFWLRSLQAYDMKVAIADDAEYADEVPSLHQGWNLVGINSDMTVDDLVSLYVGKGYTTIESVWVYKSSTWYLYIPDVTLDAQVDSTIPRITTPISRTDGIWIRLKGK